MLDKEEKSHICDLSTIEPVQNTRLKAWFCTVCNSQFKKTDEMALKAREKWDKDWSRKC